jgi:hypothetical protein
LGLSRSATAYEIERACQKYASEFAAEHFSSRVVQDVSAELQEIAEVLADARWVLSDARRRDAYARHLP